MSVGTTKENGQYSSIESTGKTRDRDRSRLNEKSVERTVESEPQSVTAAIIAVGASVPLGLALAALATTLFGKDERVAVASWIAVAIVGSASVISAAAVSRRRIVSTGRENDQVHSLQRFVEKTPEEVVELG